MRRRKEKACHERKVIDEKAELRLASAPMRRPVKRKSEENDVGRRQQRGFGKESSGQQANGERQLEERRQPGEKLRNREAGRLDISRRSVDIHQLECQCHEEDRSEDQASYENGYGWPPRGSCIGHHRNSYHYWSLRRGRYRAACSSLYSSSGPARTSDITS